MCIRFRVRILRLWHRYAYFFKIFYTSLYRLILFYTVIYSAYTSSYWLMPPYTVIYHLYTLIYQYVRGIYASKQGFTVVYNVFHGCSGVHWVHVYAPGYARGPTRLFVVYYSIIWYIQVHLWPVHTGIYTSTYWYITVYHVFCLSMTRNVLGIYNYVMWYLM